ncbi:tetratricopeptide repeat protein [Acidobacteria bacterium AH-259-G07]|nr:tetratricopeptide repeat protein [Acidobacteria bacterium AH-259-G07]
MKNVLVSFLLTAVLSWTYGQTPREEHKGLEERLRSARSYESQDKFLEAVVEYRQALELEPTHEQAAIALARLLYKLGRYQEAYDVNRQVLGVHPELLKVRLNLAYLLQAQGNLQEAEEQIRVVLEKLKEKVSKDDPVRVHALHLMGRNLLGRQRYDEGEQRLLEVLELKPDLIEAHLNLAELYSQSQQSYQKAVDHFEKVLELRSNLPFVHQELGKTLLNLDRTQQAIDHFQKAIELDPNLAEAYFLLSAAYRKQGDVEKTQQILSRFQALDSESQIQEKSRLKGRSLYLEGEEHLWRDNLDQALKAFQKALEVAPDSHEACFGLAQVYLNRGSPLEALRNIEKALELQPYDSMYHYTRAVCLHELKNIPAAVEAVKKAINLNPVLPDYHNLLGNLLFTKEEHREAASAYRKAVDLDPDNPLYHLNLSSALAKLGSLEESKKEKELYLKLLTKRSD